MDQISKALKKLSVAERKKIKLTVTKLKSGSFSGLDIKKLKDRSDIYRLRIGNIRILFRRTETDVLVLKIARRNEKTYKE